MKLYLYLKQHRVTGLKYLGKTKNDPFKYLGSGKYWKSHLEMHGIDISTEILKECESDEELRHWGKYYSELWDVVRSNEWANLKTEEGEGGKHGESTKNKISEKLRGRKKPPRSEAHCIAISKAKQGKPLSNTCTEGTKEKRRINQLNKKASEQTKKAISDGLTGRTLSEEHKKNISLTRKGWEKNIAPVTELV